MTDRMEWLKAVLAELEMLRAEAAEQGESLLAYLIDMAAQEAQERLRAAQTK